MSSKKKNPYRSVRKRNRTLRKTRKVNIPNEKRANIVKQFMEVLVMIKLYHWKTHSYSQHKATDHLYEQLNENIDHFVEVLSGKYKHRIFMLEKNMKMYDLHNKQELKEHLFEFRSFLIDMNRMFHQEKHSDLLSIRDDILADINQFLYLLTFDK
jgi:flagellar basal body-associated protein FliL